MKTNSPNGSIGSGTRYWSGESEPLVTQINRKLFIKSINWVFRCYDYRL